MRKIVQALLLKPVLWFAERFASKPDRARIYKALTDLLNNIENHKTAKGLIVPFEMEQAKFIIFSDQHKGAKNGADDFMSSETNYVEALKYYELNGYHFISLGDSEELWENTVFAVQKHNKLAFEAEGKFISKNAFIKIFGNHDLDWGNDPFVDLYMKTIYKESLKVYEGVLLQTTVNKRKLKILCTHGHQGDKQSDGNWFSKFFVAKIWAPLQAYLRINPNTPAYDSRLKTLHNSIMYDWSADQKDLLLVTGHTHQPVFESLTHLERLYRRLRIAEREGNLEEINGLKKEIEIRKFQLTGNDLGFIGMKPCYFNSGCCCFSDGDITGLEILLGKVMLIKWKLNNGIPERIILEEVSLIELEKLL